MFWCEFLNNVLKWVLKLCFDVCFWSMFLIYVLNNDLINDLMYFFNVCFWIMIWLMIWCMFLMYVVNVGFKCTFWMYVLMCVSKIVWFDVCFHVYVVVCRNLDVVLTRKASSVTSVKHKRNTSNTQTLGTTQRISSMRVTYEHGILETCYMSQVKPYL